MNMNYITTTQLRTKSSQLVDALRKGTSVSLIHRSEVIGKIQPAQEPKPFDPEVFRKLLKEIKPKKLIPREDRDKVYRAHLEEKYGKNLPGR